MITDLRVLKSKKGDFYAQASLEDMAGSIDMLVFPEAYRKLQEKVKLQVPVLIRGGVRIEEGANPKLTVNDILPLEEAKCRFRNLCVSVSKWRTQRMSRLTNCILFAASAKEKLKGCLIWNARG